MPEALKNTLVLTEYFTTISVLSVIYWHIQWIVTIKIETSPNIMLFWFYLMQFTVYIYQLNFMLTKKKIVILKLCIYALLFFSSHRAVILRTAMIAIIVYFWAISNVPDETNRPVSYICLDMFSENHLFCHKNDYS